MVKQKTMMIFMTRMEKSLYSTLTTALLAVISLCCILQERNQALNNKSTDLSITDSDEKQKQQ